MNELLTTLCHYIIPYLVYTNAMRRGRVLYFLAVVPCLPLLMAALYWMLQVGRDQALRGSTHFEPIQRRWENTTWKHDWRGVGKHKKNSLLGHCLLHVVCFPEVHVGIRHPVVDN